MYNFTVQILLFIIISHKTKSMGIHLLLIRSSETLLADEQNDTHANYC